MATAYKNSNKSTRKEVGASALLNDFTDASRAIQHMDSTTSERDDYYKEMVKELQKQVGDASRKSELSINERIAIEDRINDVLENLSRMPADKLKEALSEFVKKEKGQSYEAAVKRVAKLTSDLKKLADSAPYTASYELETAIRDFSTPVKKSSGRKGQNDKREVELQIAKDLKIIRKAAIIEELAEKLVQLHDSDTGIAQVMALEIRSEDTRESYKSNPDKPSSQKPKIVVAKRVMAQIPEEEIMPLSELLRKGMAKESYNHVTDQSGQHINQESVLMVDNGVTIEQGNQNMPTVDNGQKVDNGVTIEQVNQNMPTVDNGQKVDNGVTIEHDNNQDNRLTVDKGVTIEQVNQNMPTVDNGQKVENKLTIEMDMHI